MRQHPTIILALTACGCTALWTGQAVAQDSATQIELEQLQQQIQQLQQHTQQLQQQVQKLKTQQKTQRAQPAQAQAGAKPAPKAQSGPTKKLKMGGAVVTEYEVVSNHGPGTHQNHGGKLILDYFALDAQGQYGDLSFGAEGRFSSTNFADSSYLRHGWAAYDFTNHHQLKGGFFQVPFGNYPTGYQNFWGSLAYFTGFTDNQAAGVGYKYNDGPWRVDVDAFKNDDLTQQSLYGSNPFHGYQQINGGNIRLAYTFNHGGDDTVNVSAAVRGGQLDVGGDGDPADYVNGNRHGSYGTHWAATAAADAEISLWTIQGQFVDYRYNIPSGRYYDGAELSTHSVTFENYGFKTAQLPASGQLYAVNIARKFPVDIGPIEKFVVYDNYGYLHSGQGDCDDTITPMADDMRCASGGYRIGDIQQNVLGAEMAAGPLQLWADFILGKNDAIASTGPNDNDWHPRFNLAASLSFDGNLIKD
jgi:hypothetical protein